MNRLGGKAGATVICGSCGQERATGCDCQPEDDINSSLLALLSGLDDDAPAIVVAAGAHVPASASAPLPPAASAPTYTPPPEYTPPAPPPLPPSPPPVLPRSAPPLLPRSAPPPLQSSPLPLPSTAPAWSAPGRAGDDIGLRAAPSSGKRFDFRRVQWKSVMSVSIAIAITLAFPIGRQQWGHETAAVHYPAAWDPRVADIAHFVEQNRGSTFLHPIAVEFLAPAAFKAKMGDQVDGATTAEERAQFDQAAASLRALGLVHGTVDLKAAEKKLHEEAIVGQYDPRTKEIMVRGSELTPDARVTLAHELTHALQDQRFDLLRLQKDQAHDTAIRSLIEADAMRIEDLYVDSLSDADRQAYEGAQHKDDADLSGVPDVLTHSLAFPYVFGPAFVSALYTEGGAKEVDLAFARPPVSEAEIVNPKLWLDGFHLAEPAAPKAAKGEKRLAGWTSPFGQESMAEVLAPVVGFDAAWKAVQGWRGDMSSTFTEKSGRICLAVSTRFATLADATTYKAAADKWAAAAHGTVSGGGTLVDLRACDPGPAAAGLPKADADPFDVLGARAAFIKETLHAADDNPDAKAIDLAMATCVADATLQQVGAPALAALSKPDASDDAVARVIDAGKAAAQMCATLQTKSLPGSTKDVALNPPLGPSPLTTAPVWPAPADASAKARDATFSMLPAEGSQFHFHAVLAVSIDGQHVVVPVGIGIDRARGAMSEVHTHKTTGVIHIESNRTTDYTLGQFFVEWGQPLGPNHIGSLTWGPDRVMHVFVNGVEVHVDPATIVLRPYLEVKIAVAPAGAAVAPPAPYDWEHASG